MSQSNLPLHTPIQKANDDWVLLRTENAMALEQLEYLNSEVQRMKERDGPDSAIFYSAALENVELKMKCRKLEGKNKGLEQRLSKTSREMVFVKNAQHEAELGGDSESLHKVYGARDGDYNPDHRRACNECGHIGHSGRNCEKAVCSRCGGNGHYRRNCPGQ